METGKILLLARFLRVFFGLQAESNKNSIMTLHKLKYNSIMLLFSVGTAKKN